jgi:AcrR family transcriptional regulator
MTAGTQPNRRSIRSEAANRSAPERLYRGLPSEARREDQRERLLRAATEVFARSGFANASVDEIVAGARVSRTSFYEFFPNKESCLLAVFELGMQRLFGALAHALTKELTPREQVREAVRTLAGTLAADPPMARVLLIEAVGATPATEAARAEARQALAAAGERQLEAYGQWRRRSAREREIVSLASMAAIAELISQLVATDRLGEWESVVEPVSEFVLGGLVRE